ncbi:hypothetical protein GS501_04960 [Saccharibacter sp. 17.LH.SD]|uniref:phage baseplate plug family protein n=1 Tax=Saccharibacter sp. 17.LH.SD TaxID=2689393 RepID=UPI0013716084|nr:hypothetical protein [Saccharibacter sp. 17.LH.SD]MXV44397.1 hypothetical protein [Saccharibacter sp. 17.LH.SD]
MIYSIPLDALPSQETSCTLSGQACRFWVRQLATGLYIDVWVNQNAIVSGCLCRNNVDILQNPASPLPGTLMVVDQQGAQDPDYTGLGDRYLLIYTERSS